MLGVTDRDYCDIQTFTGFNTLSSATGYWDAYWIKPRGFALAKMQGISAGGGGGGGHSAASGSARGGGGGGGGGAIVNLLIAQDDIPDVLYIGIGKGGLGGAATQDGAAGGYTFIAANPLGSIDASNLLMFVSGTAAQPGTKGTGAAGGSGGSAGSATTLSNQSLAQAGLFQCSTGQQGKVGGAHTGAVGQDATMSAGVGVCMGGAGGAGVGADDVGKAGGTVTAISNARLSEAASTVAAAAGSNPGAGGYVVGPPDYPFWAFPGCGGASNGTGVGGAGGDSVCGSGGGGGGGGTTGGKGGDGGHGRVRIISFGVTPP